MYTIQKFGEGVYISPKREFWSNGVCIKGDNSILQHLNLAVYIMIKRIFSRGSLPQFESLLLLSSHVSMSKISV